MITIQKDRNVLNSFVLLMAICYYTATFFVAIVFADSSLDTLILLALLGLMFLAYVFANNFVIKVEFSKVLLYFLLLALLFYLSSLWAISSKDSIWWGTEILEITFGLAIISLCFNNDATVERLVTVIVIGGYCVVVYAIIVNGFGTIISIISQSSRLTNDAINANTLGMCAAYAIIGNAYLLLKKQFNWWMVLAIPAIAVLIASGSRKALFAAAIGTVFLIMVFSSTKKNKEFKLIRNIFIVIIFIVLVVELANTAAFAGIGERIQQLINGLSGKGSSDNSTLIRFQLFDIGVNIFKDYPFFGIGADNAKYVAGPVFGLESYYLHNNYIELLADVGIIGFIIYYSIYAYLLVTLIKYRDSSSPEYCFCLTLLIIMLIMDFGMVSYQSKDTYYYLLVVFTETELLKKQRREESINV